MREAHTNWAGNHRYAAARLHRPETTEQVRELVARGGRLRVLGTRHSFNGIADTDGELVSLERLRPVTELDRGRGVVTVDGGATYGRLCRDLGREGYALHNLASLPHVSVAGACATATHGSGDRNACLAAAVSALELVAGTGEVVALSRERDGERFRGAVVGLGGLGVVTRLTLDVQPAYEVRQEVYEGLPLERLEAHFDEIMSSAYSASLFTSWSGDRVDQVWLKRRVGDGGPLPPAAELFGAAAATGPRHPVAGMPAESCTPQMGVAGPWHERLPHFRMERTPSAGRELHTDYLVPRERAWAALLAVDGLRGRVAPLLQVSEVRTVAADDLWMSPFYRRACVSIHFTWKPDWPAVRELLPRIEERLLPLGARPHWAKLFTVPAERVRALYERLPEFRALLRQYDPEGRFRNAFLDAYVFGED